MYKNIFVILLALLTVLLLITILLSLNWPLVHDSPVQFYIGYLMNEYGAVPFKDIYEQNMMGTYFLHALIGKITGYDYFHLRLVDIFLFIIICINTFGFLRKFPLWVPWIVMLFFGYMYFAVGPFFSFQREYLIMPFLTSALHLGSRGVEIKKWWLWIIIGLLLGICSLIKPHALIIFPLIVLYYKDTQNNKWQNLTGLKKIIILIPGLFLTGSGILILWTATIMYMIATGSLSAFVDIALHYWPLYGSLSNSMSVLSGLERFSDIIYHLFMFNRKQWWIIPIAYGIYLGVKGYFPVPEQKKVIVRFIICALLFWLYPAFSGQFWSQHWLPFYYFISLFFAFIFIPGLDPSDKKKLNQETKPHTDYYIALIFMAVLFLQFFTGDDFDFQIPRYVTCSEYENERYQRAKEIAAFLKDNVKEGETVQPLDWTNGVVHGMLLARAKLATSFPEDFYFYHHARHPYIQALRKRFMNELKESKPSYIIRIKELYRFFFEGDEAAYDFPELRIYIEEFYEINVETKKHVIYVRKNLSRIPVQ